MHAVIVPEKLPRQRQHLAVTRMIECRDRRDAPEEVRVPALDVLCQLHLGARRAGDQYRAGVRQGLRHALEKGLVDGGVAAVARIGLVVEVLMGVAAVHDGAVGFLLVKLEDSRFVMIDPDERVIVLIHGFHPLLRNLARAPAAEKCSPWRGLRHTHLPGTATGMSAFPTHLQSLLDPRAYPHAVTEVTLVETHVSWVLLTGKFAYKLKRPVHYPFVDLRSSERRTFLCHEEVRLNRRFAPELYLDVCPITLEDGAARIDGPGTVIEHAVRMRQFPHEEQLDELLAAGRIEPAELDTFGHELVRAHARLPEASPEQPWGRPDALRTIVDDNVAEVARAVARLGVTFPPSLPPAVAAAVEAALPLLAARFASGCVRECHGDLHARNVVRLSGGLRAFDCLEFEPALRWTDVADDIAFLLADLTAQRHPLHAQAFLAGYLSESGDYEACRCLPLFRAHRALVRSKVAALAAFERNQARRDIEGVRRESEAYLECALDSLAERAPLLVLMSGLSGSGKTWLAQRLAPRLGAVHVRSDVERKRLAGLAAADRSHSALAQGLYAPTATHTVYHRLLQCANDVLAGGYTAIVDATFGEREHRAQFAALAARLGVRILMVHCQAPVAMLKARILERQRRDADPSEADVAVLEWQRSHFEPIEPVEGFAVHEATTAEPQALDELLRRIGAQPTVSAL